MKKLSLLFLILAISGCSTAMVSNKKIVHDNTFYSTYRPKSKINVNSEYEYVGNIVKSKLNTEYASDIEYNRYVFIKYDENKRIESGIEILISTIKNGRAIWLSDSFKGAKNLVFNNVLNIFDKNYKQAVLIESPGNVGFYNEKGFICPSKGIAWGIARNIDTENKVKFEVYYWEDLEKFNDKLYGNPNWQYSGWLETSNYDTRKQNAIDEFVKRAKSSIVVSDLTKEEYDGITSGLGAIQEKKHNENDVEKSNKSQQKYLHVKNPFTEKIAIQLAYDSSELCYFSRNLMLSELFKDNKELITCASSDFSSDMKYEAILKTTEGNKTVGISTINIADCDSFLSAAISQNNFTISKRCTARINKSINEFIVSYFEDEIERSVFLNSLSGEEAMKALIGSISSDARKKISYNVEKITNEYVSLFNKNDFYGFTINKFETSGIKTNRDEIENSMDKAAQSVIGKYK